MMYHMAEQFDEFDEWFVKCNKFFLQIYFQYCRVTLATL